MVPLILVVEDDEALNFNLKIVLEYNGYNVISAFNGINALKKLSEIKKAPDIIITDVNMPKMNGYDLFKSVSNNPIWNRIPFVFLTGRSTAEDVESAKSLGVNNYIKKPFTENDLISVISSVISR